MYVDTGSPVPNIPSKSRGLADENKVFDGMEMIRNNRFKILPKDVLILYQFWYEIVPVLHKSYKLVLIILNSIVIYKIITVFFLENQYIC